MLNPNAEPRTSHWATDAADNFDAFLALLSQKALTAVEKHAEQTETDAAQGYGRTWKRLAGMLGRLAPWSIEAVGRQSLKFHIPDGKYRVQVFALENSTPGTLRVYLPDITAAALEQHLLLCPHGDGKTFTFPDSRATVELETLTAETQDAPAFCKPMLGWGRKALRITLPALTEEPQLRAVESLCELAAQSWKDQPLPEAPAAS